MEKPNLTYIHNLSGGDKEFKKKIISIIKEEYPEEINEYYTNFNLKNYSIAATNVHKLKHKISILGLEESYEIAAEYENNLKEGNSILSDKFEIILQNITDYLITL
ncbi:Hpt domain-containing protein [Lutibacter sp. B1]|uniref:Hpt domain-containing protein n=1 Tax=Lutibacter sp. B1 TaxID=2725996 RepID=UPI001456721A|nr:Hpt domain-containing protein [Lutibacter sp. B1]NLP59185.1 Hpt domain-containing protein [Lutibacter sp. B1]